MANLDGLCPALGLPRVLGAGLTLACAPQSQPAWVHYNSGGERLAEVIVTCLARPPCVALDVHAEDEIPVSRAPERRAIGCSLSIPSRA
jgi:hypothetical protein